MTHKRMPMTRNGALFLVTPSLLGLCTAAWVWILR